MMLLLHWLWIIVLIVLMVSVLVAAHEYGHYLFARMFKMGVEEFAIGFGKKPLIVWMRKKHTVLNDQTGENLQEETEFTIRPWPLGGFVRIKGMVPEADGSEIHIPGGFYSKAPWKRFIVLLMGPVFSIVAGMLLLIPIFAISGKYVSDNRPIMGKITAKGPADKAGLKQGDKIIAIAGKPVKTYFDVISTVRDSGGKELSVRYMRDDVQAETQVSPLLDTRPSPVLDENLEPTGETKIQSKLQVQISRTRVPVSFGEAVLESVRLPIESGKRFVAMFTAPKELTENLSGPVGIAQATNEASTSWEGIVSLAAILSISVGFLNLLPVPPLDGGQMAIALAEMLRSGRRLSIKVQMIVNATGMGLLALLMMSAFYMDFKRLGERNEQKPPAKASQPGK